MSLTIRVAARGVYLVVLSGRDVGELGDAPFRELDRLLGEARAEIFIDAREARSATPEVSAAWARFLGTRRDRLARVTMLTANRFLAVSAELVRQYSDLGAAMRVVSDAGAFEAALGAAIAARAADGR